MDGYRIFFVYLRPERCWSVRLPEGLSLDKFFSSPVVASRERKLFVLLLIILFVAAGLKAFYSFREAGAFNEYVSDEVWYVPSARNILVHVFHHNPSYKIDGKPVYTYIFSDKESLNQCIVKLSGRHPRYKGFSVVKEDFQKLYAISIAGLDPNYARSICGGIVDYIPGYPPPDKEGINTYYNLEHPPLGKYFIALSMKLFGDAPLSWRIPGVIEGAFLVIVAGLIGWRLLGLLGGVLGGAAALLDPLTTHMSSVAMLDIHLGFFTALTVLFFVYDRRYLAVVSAFLSSMVKYSGFFIIPFVYIYLRRRNMRPLKAIVTLLILGLIVILPVNLPLIAHFGFGKYVSEFIGALKWHTSSRPPGPVASNPLEWIVGWNSFLLHAAPDIYARGSPILYAPGFVVSLLIFPLFLSRKMKSRFFEGASGLSAAFVSIFIGYIATMVAGNRTLYSFYMTQAAPILYPLFPVSIAAILGYHGIIEKGVRCYSLFFKRLIKGKLGAYDWPSELSPIGRYANLGWKAQVIFSSFLSIALFSFILHYPLSGKPVIYSDAQWISSGGLIATQPGRLMGAQGLLGLFLIENHASLKYFLLLDFLSFFVLANEFVIFFRRERFRSYSFLALLSLSLIVYGVYDGTVISLMLFLLGLNLEYEGKRISPIILGAAAGNPILLLSGISVLSYSPLSLLMFFASFLAFTLPSLMLLSSSAWVSSFLELFYHAEAPSYLLPLGRVSWVGLPLIPLLIYLLYRKGGLGWKKPYGTAFISMLIAYLFIPTAYPQWLLPLFVIGAPLSARWAFEQISADSLNALIILFWFSNAYLTHILFKYDPSGPLDPFGLVAITAYLRDFFLFLILARYFEHVMGGSSGSRRLGE